jgi:DNA modification methylase
MISMWDNIFNENVNNAINSWKWEFAFELMHQDLDKIRDNCNRVLKEWGIACINIWDATRSINNKFQLYNNHSRIINHFIKIWFHNLPNILRRKATNSPSKFMWSWTLPVWAYVTLEHEYILIFRKWEKRIFKDQKSIENRQNSAFFYEERNIRFSDMRDWVKWIKQNIDSKVRKRSAAYPLTLPYRLINMFSVYWDTILDPFLWTWTTSLAAMVTWRNSIWIEISEWFNDMISESLYWCVELSKTINRRRLDAHVHYVQSIQKDIKHINNTYKFPVISWQEKNIKLYDVENVNKEGNTYITKHSLHSYTANSV